jgi:hypothetical protein
MAAQSMEEELQKLAALVREAERLGIDPWPPDKPKRP